jgi:hypothetical protein
MAEADSRRAARSRPIHLRRLLSALGDSLEGRKTDDPVLSPRVEAHALLELTARDPEHVDRDRPQIAAVNLSGESDERRVIAQLLPLLGGVTRAPWGRSVDPAFDEAAI